MRILLQVLRYTQPAFTFTNSFVIISYQTITQIISQNTSHPYHHNPYHLPSHPIKMISLASYNIALSPYLIMNGDEQTQTIEFYKIRLMEKDREISDFDSKLKKIEFRNNRDLKEAKAAEERAKGLLKEEKAKVDRLSKQANENQQQNNLLQLRLASLKEEKEKEVLEVRAQYNSIKEEVRSYERILPTHTFLTEIALSIEQLPTYEDIFVNLRQKITQISDLQAKFDSFKEKTEEMVRSHEQSEELLRSKKLQAERNLKEVLPRIIQYEHQISDLKIINEQYQNTIQDLRNQLAQQSSKNSQLQDSMREFQIQVQQMRQAFTHQLHSKQQEVRGSFQDEIERNQQEIKSLTSRLEIKDNMYISQIHILEEEVSFTHAKGQAEREKYEQVIGEMKEEADTFKHQLEKAKSQNQQLLLKNEETIRNLLKVASQNEQLQDKIKSIEKKIAEDTDNHQKQSKQNQKRSQHEIKQQIGKYQQLQEQYRKLKESYTQLLEEKQSIKEQNQELRMEITNHKEISQTRGSNSLELPYNAFEYEQKYRRKSTDYDKYEQELIVMQTTQKVELNKEKQRTNELIKKAEDIQHEKTSIRQELQATKDLLKQSRNQITEYEMQLSQNNRELSQLKQQIITIKTQLQTQQEKVRILNEQKVKLISENQEQKQKIVSLSKTISDSELAITGNNTKQNLLKANIQSLKEENRIILEQDKKNKELLKTQKQQIKNLKEVIIVQNEKTSKEIKELASTIETLKQEKQQIRTQSSAKEKAQNYQIAILRNNKELQEKLKSQMTALNLELSKIQQEKQIISKKYIEITKDYESSKKQIQKLQQENLQKDRQNQMINQSLDRQRRERTLRTVPSLQSLQGQQQMAQEQNFNDIYLTITRKQGQINILQREISDLKEEIESLRLTQMAKIEAMEAEQNEYIQTIIMMKVKCAQSEMRASQKEHLYNQIKKKMNKN